MGGADGASPRASNPAGKEGKAKLKKKAPTGKVSLGMPMNKSADLTEEAAKADLDALQKKYGTLVVAFNNQQAELAKCMEEKEKLEQQVESLKTSVESGVPLSGDELTQNLKEELEKSRAVRMAAVASAVARARAARAVCGGGEADEARRARRSSARAAAAGLSAVLCLRACAPRA